MNNSRRQIFDEIDDERIKQDDKWGEQNHDPITWLSILMEEIGEVSQCALHQKFGGEAAGKYRHELIQVAAVAISMLECFDRKNFFIEPDRCYKFQVCCKCGFVISKVVCSQCLVVDFSDL